MKFCIFLVISFAITSAQAFTLSVADPNFKGWPSPDIKFNLNTSNCPSSMDIKSLIEDAAQVWNNVPTSNVKVSYGDTTSSTTYAAPTTVYCETNFQSVTGADQDYVPAASAVGYQNGELVGLFYLNVSTGNANIAAYDSTQLKIIVAHEMGHILGLGHSDDPNALMYYDASKKTNFNLAQDDIDGISYLYPRDEWGKDKILGCGLISKSVPPPPYIKFYIFLFLLLPLLLWVRVKKSLLTESKS